MSLIHLRIHIHSQVTVLTGIISTIAGTGGTGTSGDGRAATSALIHSPYSVAVDAAGDLYIADMYNSKIRKVSM